MPQAKVRALSRILQSILHTHADEAARRSGFIQRQRKLTGPLWTQVLVLGWLADPEASLHQLAQHAAALGVGLSPQAIDQRFSPEAAVMLEDLLTRACLERVTAPAPAIELLERFPAGVFLLDATTVVLPVALRTRWQGCGSLQRETAAIKIHVRFDYCGGALEPVQLTPARMHERGSWADQEPIPVGALRVADLGYFSLARWSELSAAGAYWLSRLRCGTLVFDAHGQHYTAAELAQWLSRQPGPVVDAAVTLGARARLPARLIAQRVPPEVAAERRRALRFHGKRKGHTPTKARLAQCDWVVLVTNTPAWRLSAQEALVLYRVRWQVELLFKLWKQHGGLTRWRTRKPYRILCEVYAKLLGMLVTHWMVLLGRWSLAARSMVRAAQTVRAHAVHLLLSLSQPRQLRSALTVLERTLAAGCRICTRRKPATYQLLLRCNTDQPLTGCLWGHS
jgi:hypothetical protein